jgi:hypothetical protein
MPFRGIVEISMSTEDREIHTQLEYGDEANSCLDVVLFYVSLQRLRAFIVPISTFKLDSEPVTPGLCQFHAYQSAAFTKVLALKVDYAAPLPASFFPPTPLSDLQSCTRYR